jgi:Ca2+-binding RTX toxin-like protein
MPSTKTAQNMNNPRITGKNVIVKSSAILDLTQLTPVEEALVLVQDYLQSFASESDFSQKMTVAFGEGAKVDSLRMAWSTEDFSDFPEIEIRHAADINGAQGAFAKASNTIYISQEYLVANVGNSNAIARVLLEEIGHFVDSKINIFDAQGDEGAIFSSLVQGVELTSQELEAIRIEDDTAFIQVDGQRIQIEQAIDINALIGKIKSILQTNLGKDTFDIKFDENASLTSPFWFKLLPGSNIPKDVKGFLPTISGFVRPTGGGFALQDITLDTQSLLGAESFLGKIKKTLETIIKPIQPIVDILLKPVPLLSDLSESLGDGLKEIYSYDGRKNSDGTISKEISILDVIGFVAKTQDIDFDPSLIVKGIETFKFLDTLTDKIKPEGIKLGTINFDANGSSVKQGLPNLNLFKNPLPPQEGLSIPLLQNPSDTVLDLLLGKSVDLFKYQLPQLKLQGTITQIVPVIGPLGVSIGGTFDINTNLGFGFDTSGFKTNKIEQGIYFTDKNAKGEDVPEFNFGIGPVVGAGLQLAVASIDVFTGMQLNLGIDLADTNNDGKLSLNEFDGLNSFDYKFSLGSPKVGGSVKILGANVFSPETPDFVKIDLGTIKGEKINSELTQLTKGIDGIKDSFKDGIDDIKKALDIKIPSPAELAKKAGEILGDGAEAVKDAAAKGAANLDPTNPKSPVSQVLRDLDPTNPNGKIGGLVKDAEDGLAKLDPFNTNSPVGKGIAALGKELKNVAKAAAELDITNKNSLAGKAWAATGLPPISAPKLSFGLVADAPSRAEELQNLLNRINYAHKRMAEINTYLEGIVNGRIGVVRRSEETDIQAKDRVIQEQKKTFNSYKKDAESLITDVKSKNWPELIKEELLRNGITLKGDSVKLRATYKNEEGIIRLEENVVPLVSDQNKVFPTSKPYGTKFITGPFGIKFPTSKIETLQRVEVVQIIPTDDVFISSSGSDSLYGDAGNDNLNSGGGFDKLSGGRGNDYLNAGEGTDYLTGDSGNDQLHGGTGNDHLYGYSDDYYFTVVNDPNESDNDSLYGGSGDDFLDGGKGDDLLRGGDGSSLDSNNPDKTDKDMLIGGSGNDTLYGGEDDDRLFGGADNDLLYGEAGNDLLYGAEGNDLLDGGTGNDILNGNDGQDTLHGGSDRDLLFGGDGEDKLYGDGGNDILRGGLNNDLLDGGDDADELWGEEDVDTLYGGRGIDSLYGGQATDYLYGGLEDDVLYGGIAGNDAFDASNDYLYGEEGNDRLYGQAGNDELDGGEGNDSLYGGDNNDLIKGGSQDDALYGGAGEDLLYGEQGIDSLYGGEDNDRLYGGENNDFLYGEGGNDVLYADGEADYLNGGYSDTNNYSPSGNDTYIIDSVSSGGTVIEDYDGFASDNDQVLLPIELSEDLATGLDTSAVKNFIRQGQDLIIDLNQDGTFSSSLDLTLKNFFLRDQNTREPLYRIEKINQHITGDALLKYFNVAPKINVANNFDLDGVDLIPNANNGNLIAEIIPDGGFEDPDAVVDAIAITSIKNNIGTWQYSIDNGQTWQDFAAVSDSNALLLKPSDRVRFNPDLEKIKLLQEIPGNNSWRGSEFSFRAWDLSDEAQSGTYTNITKTGGNSAFSTETTTAKVSLLLEPPINTWSLEIKNYPATVTDPTLPSDPTKPRDTRTPDQVGMILHDAVLSDKNIFLVGNTTGTLSEGQNFFGGYNDTWLASVDVATGEVKGKLVLATPVSDARAKVAWAKNNSDTVYMSFRAFGIGTINSGEQGWLNKYNFATGEHTFVNVTNNSTGLVYPTDIDTDINGNLYALFNIKNGVSNDGIPDNKVVVYDSNLNVINSIDIGHSRVLNKITVSKPGSFTVAGFKTTDGQLGIDVGGYDVLRNSAKNTQSIWVANIELSSSNQYGHIYPDSPVNIDYYDIVNGQTAHINNYDIVTDLQTANGITYITTNSAAIAYNPQQLGVWSSKIFKTEQLVTGLAVDENQNAYVLGRTAVDKVGSTAWVTKYGESLNNAPELNFDVAPAIWHKANAQGAATNGFNYFPNELLFDPNNKLGMALVGRATKFNNPDNVFAEPEDYVWGTGLKSINHAPTLVNSKDFVFLNNNQSETIYLDSKPLPTYSVASLISANSSSNPNNGNPPLMGDLDRDTLGVAITNVDNANGVWEFSKDNGASWLSSSASSGELSENNAALLGPNVILRFVPKLGYIGSSSFNFRLWDLTNSGSRENLSVFSQTSLIDPEKDSVGGTDTPYSAITGTARIDITNHSPVFTTDYLPQIPSISYRNPNSTGIQVDSLVPNGAVQDGTYSFLNNSTGQTEYLTVDKAVRAIAVTSVDNSNGQWQFSSSTGNWIDFGNVTENTARLLNPDYKIRFVPNGSYIGNSSFTFRAWDQTNGNAGEIFDATANGGTATFSSETRTATITTTNTAPYVTSYSQEPLVLRTISHNNSNDSSETIADLLPDIFYDEDETTKSIAVTQVDNSNGIWQYSLNDGEGWSNIGTVSQTRTLLLDSQNKIRFVPNLNFVGRSSFSFKAWDGSSGIAGLTADVTNNDGQTPFSFNTETVEFHITNAAPRFLQSESPVGQFSAIGNTNINPLGNTIAEILADDAIIDDDGNPQKAIAIVSTDSSNGRWQYSLDYGDTWQDIASISTGTALLLAADSKVRFIPNTEFVGAASFSFRAWDKTIGTAGQLIDTSSNGDNKAFSTEIQKVEIAVTNIDKEGETIATALDTGLNAFNKGVVELVGSIGNNPSKLPGHDVDFYKIQLNQDDIVNVKLVTDEIDSPLDASVWIYDSQGLKLAFSDRSTYFDEPFISFSAPYTDTYYLSVSASGNEPYSPFLEEGRQEITDTSGDYILVLDAVSIKLAKIADDIFTITNSSGKSKLKVTLTEQTSNLVNELGVFTVDDAQGKIDDIAPGEAGYAQAALNRAKVIFSAIANLPNGFNTKDLTHLLEFNSGENLRFYLVRNSTTDAVRAGVTPLTDILFSDPLKQKITDLGSDGFSLAWKDKDGNSTADFKDLVVKIQSTNDSLPLGTNLQGKSQGEIIDLRGITSQVKADFVVNREAAFNNFIGFYQVADENGGIDSNGDGKADIFAGQAGYIEAAIRGRVAGIDLTVNNQGTATYSGTFQPGSIFAPFIIANGSPDALLDSNPNNNPAVYFPFLGANADKVDHIHLLGNNVFGFEDLANGGDKDFNDVIVRVNLSIA